MTLFFLCAWHTITIGDNGNDVYMVIADSNLIKGVPEFYNLMGEFVKTLREFNGKTGDFKLMVSSALVMDSPIDYIENSVLGAQHAELGSIKEVKADEHPYAGVCSKIEELKKLHPLVTNPKWLDVNQWPDRVPDCMKENQTSF